MVHWYGRASEVPEWLRGLGSADAGVREVARQQLERCLEHQDGLSQATPFATSLILEALHDSQLPEKPALLNVLCRIAAAASYQLGSRNAASPLSLDDLLSPARLRPAFESEEEDEALAETWDVSQEEFDAYHVLTAEALVRERFFLAGLARQSEELRQSTEPLLTAIASLARILEA
jgi:hypothetical protein